MLGTLLFVFLWLIGTIICIILLVHCIRFGRKFERELQQRYPEVVEKRKKYSLKIPIFPIRYPAPLENDMLDEEFIDLKRKACFSLIGLLLVMGLLLIFSFLLHVIFAK
jgi:hypothetical protein